MEPLVYHLKNYGVKLWYDRHALVLGDSRKEKNLDEGARECNYAIIVISKHTDNSICAMEELSILEERYYQKDVTVFPILYEILPDNIPYKLQWVRELIFKEVDRHSGTLEICNHIACKITDDLLKNCNYKSIEDLLSLPPVNLPLATHNLLANYQKVDYANLNARVALLYAAYLVVICNKLQPNYVTSMISKIFERLFSETRLNLTVDYRELWLLENSICILVNTYLSSCIDSKI